MRVLHIVPTIARESGGPARSTQGLVTALRENGVEAWLLSMTPGEVPWLSGFDDSAFLCADSRGYFAWKRVVRDAIEKLKPDLLHLHQIWTLDLHAASVVARESGIPYIIAPRGSLEPWALEHKWLKKWIARRLYQDCDLRQAAALHATASSEADRFRELGFRNPIINSPNGVNVPCDLPPREHGLKRRALFLSRMVPNKGILELVEAWGRVRPEGWECELVYTMGNEDERLCERHVHERVSELGLNADFIFTGALSDDEKWKAYRRANLFVLPTYTENFGIVIAEALYAGLPVITTKGTPWREIEGTCGWWIDIGVEPLAHALQHAIKLSDDERRIMGEMGRKIVEANYMWGAVSQKLRKVYSEMLGHDDTPSGLWYNNSHD